MSVQRRFGDMLRQAWERSRLKQRELADCINDAVWHLTNAVIDQRQVANWINGRNIPKERYKYLALSQALYRSVPQGLRSLDEINELLAAADRTPFQPQELEDWLPELVEGRNGAGPGGNIQGNREEVRGNATESKDDEPIAGPNQADANDSGLGNHPPNASNSGAPVGPEPRPWYTHFMVGLGKFLNRLEPSEHYGMIGAVILATFCLWLTWQSPAQWSGRPVDAILLGASLWVVSIIIVVPPSVDEPFDRDVLWWRRKLYRFSGAVWGVFLAISLLLWLDGLWQLVGGTVLPQLLVFLVIFFGAVFAYAAGANLQWWLVRGPATVQFYSDTARFFSLTGLIAQVFIVLFFYYLLQPIWSFSLILIFVVPAVMMIIESVKRKPPK